MVVVGGMHGCRGARMFAGACMVVGGHAWLQGCVCGCGGLCMVERGMHGCWGHVWLLGCVCMVAGGCAWLLGLCMVEGGVHGCWGACIGHDKIQSMSGQYTSYWNAFLFMTYFHRAGGEGAWPPRPPGSATGLLRSDDKETTSSL